MRMEMRKKWGEERTVSKKSCVKNRKGAHKENGIKVVLSHLVLCANTAQKQREQQQTHFQPMILKGKKIGHESNLSEALSYCVRERIQQREQTVVS